MGTRGAVSQSRQTGGAVATLLILLIGSLLGGCASSTSGTTRTSATKTPAPPSATPIPFTRPEFQTGVVFPRWGADVYGATDTDFNQGVTEVKRQTGAQWLEIVVTLYQDDVTSTDVHAGSGTATPEAVAAGILTAKEAGFHVFVVPHLLVTYGSVPDAWGGFVTFRDPALQRAWFDGYWKALEPYAQVAARTGAEEFSVGNEYIGLENVPDALWNTLIARTRAVYSGVITYNTNWSSLDIFARRLPGWLKNPALAYIGVSCYQSLVSAPATLTVQQIEQVWRQQFLPRLDALSNATQKPVLISEIGYRNSTDALYQPWVHSTGAPADPKLQAAAYEGAVRSALGDHHIQGIYFYAWENGPFAPDNLPAAQVLHSIYLSPDA